MPDFESQVHIRPLQKQGYYREPDTEKQIRWMLQLSHSEVCRLAEQKKDSAISYIKEETIVYFLREYIANEDKKSIERLILQLQERSNRYITQQISHLKMFSPLHAEQCAEEIFHRFFAAILDSSEKNEFWEIRFWVCLQRVILNTMNKHRPVIANETNPQFYKDDSGRETNSLDMIPDTYSVSPQRQIESREAIETLTHRQYEAAMLLFEEGWTQREVADHYGVTDKTIRNWMTGAREKLAAYYGRAGLLIATQFQE